MADTIDTYWTRDIDKVRVAIADARTQLDLLEKAIVKDTVSNANWRTQQNYGHAIVSAGAEIVNAYKKHDAKEKKK